MNPSCIVRPHRAGLFSNLNKIITVLRIYDHVGVDWSQGSIYGDCWNDLFGFNDPVFPGENYDTITDYPFYDLTAQMAGILYQNEGWGWRQKFHPLWKKLKCKHKGQELPEGTVGFLIRSHGHAGEQLSGLSQTLDEYAQQLGKLKPEHIFVVSSDQESLDWIRQRFGHVIWFEAKRTPNRNSPDRHLSEPQTKDDAILVLREVLTLANCSTFVHCTSNMATAALIINPELRSIYLR